MTSELPSPGTGEATPSPAPRPRPVQPAERVEMIDVLRGVALLGILLINVYAFAMPRDALDAPSVYGGTGLLDLGTWAFTHTLVYGKFISIFAMLFGAGLILMGDRLEARGASVRGVHYRRNLWLLVIGVVHAALIWWGDILITYALAGFLIYPLRRRSPRALLIWGTVLVLLTPLASLAGKAFYHPHVMERAAELEAKQAGGEALTDDEAAELRQVEEFRTMLDPPTAAELDSVIVLHREGSYGELVRARVPEIPEHALPFVVLAAGLMFLGMALMKTGVFAGTRSRGFYVRAIAIGYGVGIPLCLWSTWDHARHDFDMANYVGLNLLVNEIGNVAVALGHVGVVVLLVHAGRLGRLRPALAAVGRTALSNYLLTSVVFTFVFYGWGFDGLFGRVNRFPQMAFVVAWWAIQLPLSVWWLPRFRYGPAEWAWRSLTYWRVAPFRSRA